MGTGPGGVTPIWPTDRRPSAEFIPGQPNMIVEHMPGAGAPRGNHIYNTGCRTAAEDASGPSPAVDRKAANDGVRFQSKKLQWLGASTTRSASARHLAHVARRFMGQVERKPVVLVQWPFASVLSMGLLAEGRARREFPDYLRFPRRRRTNMAMVAGEIAGGRCGGNIPGGTPNGCAARKVIIPVQFTLRAC